ncbi:MAG TPA: hypothetical protein PKJ41_04455 [Bryobacteraceae bacterium]|nr:hypothetical protein [Bryobacteraceae bacterium]HPT25212.1 hypothetical protein [Bryobacteraceae bacterium]
MSDAYLSAIHSQDPKASRTVPVEEIMHLASKLKRLYLHRTGLSKTIEREASAYYEEHLKRIDPALHAAYTQIKQADATRELKAAVFAQLSRVCPDRDVKARFIETKLALDPVREQQFIIEAAQQIAYRKTMEEVTTLKRLFTRLARSEKFESFLNLVRYIEDNSIVTLFHSSLIQALARAYAGQDTVAIFYKCLRLTHERGRVSFYPGLDDHIGSDRHGNLIIFPGDGEVYQLATIANIARAFVRFGVRPQTVVLVCDFDLQKFSGYETPRQDLLHYVGHLKHYFDNNEVTVVLQTEYFASTAFHAGFAEVLEAIRLRDGSVVNCAQFDKIEQDYFNHYSKTMDDWNATRNEYYAIRSLSRNVAEGIELASANAIVFVFNESLVNGERFNLKTTRKVPFVGLRKPRLKRLGSAHES